MAGRQASGDPALIHFCTYFDRNYLTRGLVLYRSLQRHSPAFVLWTLCFDDEAFEAVSRLAEPGLQPIRLRDFETDDQQLQLAKATRSAVEYYFTCTPSLALYILRLDPTIETITYLDADLMFFSNPMAVLDELGSRSIGIVPHAFPPKLRHKEKYGRFNVGLVTFRNDSVGLACLASWREQCLEWCYDRVEPGRFGDQKYLDDWPGSYEAVCVFQNPGVLMAPWNFTQYEVVMRSGRVLVNDRELVFYHYQGFKPLRSWVFDLGFGGYGRMPHATRMQLYRPYIEELREASQRLSMPGRRQPRMLRGQPLRNRLRTLLRFMQGQLMFAAGRFWL